MSLQMAFREKLGSSVQLPGKGNKNGVVAASMLDIQMIDEIRWYDFQAFPNERVEGIGQKLPHVFAGHETDTLALRR